jgi:hypothetical protein
MPGDHVGQGACPGGDHVEQHPGDRIKLVAGHVRHARQCQFQQDRSGSGHRDVGLAESLPLGGFTGDDPAIDVPAENLVTDLALHMDTCRKHEADLRIDPVEPPGPRLAEHRASRLTSLCRDPGRSRQVRGALADLAGLRRAIWAANAAARPGSSINRWPT